MLEAWLEAVTSVVTLIATGITIWQSIRARTAAEVAAKDVQSFRAALSLHDLATDCSAATELLDSILQDHRDQKWERLIDRYGRFRRTLAGLKEAGRQLTSAEGALLQEALVQAVRVADRIEDRQQRPIEPVEAAELTKQIARQRDKLSSLLGRLRQRIGEAPQ